jgi:hypothetical protein
VGTEPAGAGENGSDSEFGAVGTEAVFIAYGGGGGSGKGYSNWLPDGRGKDGGSSGGDIYRSGASNTQLYVKRGIVPDSGMAYGNSGAQGMYAEDNTAAGGGGAGGKGMWVTAKKNPLLKYNNGGGPGMPSNISGGWGTYAAGGHVPYQDDGDGDSGTPKTGNGGGGGWTGHKGGAGGSGIVIIRFTRGADAP